jgi:prephenate dehydrogenase
MKIAIVGGAGKMGRWLARALANDGQNVLLIDRDESRLAEAACKLRVETSTDLRNITGSDAVIFSVPINEFEPVVRATTPFMLPGQLVLDVTSVKAMPVDVMHRCLPENVVLGTHPVFGPGAENLHGHNVVLTPTNLREEKLAEQLKIELIRRGADVSLMTPARHDELMAVVLGLAHFIALVAGDTLLHLETLADIETVSGVTFRALLTFIASVLGENPDLYAAIQMNLPTLPPLEQDFKRKAGEWADIVKEKDSAAFIKRMSDLKQKLENQQVDTSRAYADIYRMTQSPNN